MCLLTEIENPTIEGSEKENLRETSRVYFPTAVGMWREPGYDPLGPGYAKIGHGKAPFRKRFLFQLRTLNSAKTPKFTLFFPTAVLFREYG